MNGLVRDMRVPKDHDVGLWRDQRGARPRWKRYDYASSKHVRIPPSPDTRTGRSRHSPPSSLLPRTATPGSNSIRARRSRSGYRHLQHVR